MQRHYGVCQALDLANERPVPVGTRVIVEEDGIIYTGVGQTSPEIAARLGWTQPNIWLPDHALRKMQLEHKVISDHIIMASVVLQQPLSVHHGRE